MCSLDQYRRDECWNFWKNKIRGLKVRKTVFRTFANVIETCSVLGWNAASGAFVIWRLWFPRQLMHRVHSHPLTPFVPSELFYLRFAHFARDFGLLLRLSLSCWDSIRQWFVWWVRRVPFLWLQDNLLFLWRPCHQVFPNQERPSGCHHRPVRWSVHLSQWCRWSQPFGCRFDLGSQWCNRKWQLFRWSWRRMSVYFLVVLFYGQQVRSSDTQSNWCHRYTFDFRKEIYDFCARYCLWVTFEDIVSKVFLTTLE